MNKILILIDGNAIMHRAYHALPPLTNKKGELLNAVYGFTSTVLSVIEKFHPEYIAATFDLKGPTFRHKEYKEYKATRVKAPDEFYAQIPRVKEVVKTLNIPIFEKEGFEADDLIGTLSKQAGEAGENLETIIVTGDLDTLQLVDAKTKVYTLRRGITDTVLYDAEKVRERYGLEPEQMVDFKGLAGDASDNIPGVKGIGQKTAVELLKKYQTVEGVYQNISEIKGAVKTKLANDKANALLSKQLATIALNSPVKLDISKMIVHDFNRDKVVALFKELNFFSLVKRLPENTNDANDASTRTEPKKEVRDFKYFVVDGKHAGEFAKDINGQKEVAVAVDYNANESHADDANTRIKGVAFSWKTGRVFYLPYLKDNEELVKKIIENENIKKIGFDLKGIYKSFKKNNIELRGMEFDVMLAAYMLDPGDVVKLENLILSEMGEEVDWGGKKGQLTMLSAADENTAEKICQAADYSLKLKDILRGKIKSVTAEQTKYGRVSDTLENLFSKIEMPLVKILAEMEFSGVKLDASVFRDISEKIKATLGHLEKSIYQLAGREFNINSPQQLAETLYVDLKLPTEDVKKGKTGFSTAAGELEKLHGTHKIIEKIEEYRELFKLKTTYLDTFPKMIDDRSRLHTTFNQAVTSTGRLSSAEPNLQNIPVRTDLGQLMRTAFVAEDGYKLVSADYSQIDLRCVAHVSGDKTLIEAFHRGDDIHKITASAINGVTLSQVTQKMRQAAKALNFSIIYGVSPFGFSRYAGIERDEAKKFIDEYMEKFSGVARYMRETKEFAKKYGYVETLLGRRRYIPEINSPNFQVANAAERMAINMPIQGLSADIVKLAMVETDANLRMNSNLRMLLQIHDEIIWEAREDIVDEIMVKIKEIMENVVKLNVPLVVDVKAGNNWGEI